MGGRIAAVTGATGFLGRHLVRALVDDGWRVRVLVRRDPVHPLWRGTEPLVSPGGLEDDHALARLCEGAALVVHNAGLVKARSRAAYDLVNLHGAARVANAARGSDHVLLVSSMAAREPQLSDYAASKRAGELACADILGNRLTVARPPAIYGPGDRATLTLFKAAAKSPVLPILSERARIALIHVEDCARQLAALGAAPPGEPAFLSDDRPDGYTWREVMEAAAKACGRRPAMVAAPAFLVRAIGAAGGLARLAGATPILTPGKCRELLHGDWSVAPHERRAVSSVPAIGINEGFRQTVAWYRAAGWLKSE